MRCCICASGCEASTTNLSEGGTEHEKEMDLDCSASDFGDGIVHRHRRRNCDALVELVAARIVRMAANHLLAGAGTAASLPDSVRRPWCSWFSSFEYAFQDAAAHGRAVGTDDAGRARKSRSTLGTLRIRTAKEA